MVSMSNMPVIINDRLSIPADELTFTASRSAGPGGQHVNKVNSRITLMFDIEASSSLDDQQKERLREHLATRINKLGLLRVSAQKERSQVLNRRRAVERFADLLRQALEEKAERRPGKIPKRSKRRRLQDKRRRSAIKKDRRGDFDGE